LLWDLLHIALWDPPPAGLRPREVLYEPRIRIYAEHWGAPTDVGVVAEDARARAPSGACWMRLVAGVRASVTWTNKRRSSASHSFPNISIVVTASR